MNNNNYHIVYWDASAVLSVLFKDEHSDKAQEWANKNGLHLISTLSYVETCAVIARIKRERLLADILVKAALEVLHEGPWRHLNASPEWGIVQPLSDKWPLRGADLWHLATAKCLQRDLPEIFFLTFDSKLQAAAQGEHLCN